MTESSFYFISYRRDDTQVEAGAIAEAIRNKIGKEAVFLDTSEIQAGDNWPERIKDALKNSTTVLVVIGKKWLTVGQDQWGKRPIDSPDDWVRREILHALTHKIKVIPILVQNTQIPPKAALPNDLQDITSKQAININPHNWDTGLKNLLNLLNINGEKIYPNIHMLPSFGDIITRNNSLLHLAEHAEKSAVVSVLGISGIGKTYLVSDYVNRFRNSGIWYDAQNNEPLEDLLASLETEPEFDLGKGSTEHKCKLLANQLLELDKVLIIDDFHAAARETYAPLIKSVFGLGNTVRLILVTQKFIEFSNLNVVIDHVNIQGLTEDELHSFFNSRKLKLNKSIIRRLHSISGGLPLAASLFAAWINVGNDPNELLKDNLIEEDRIKTWCNKVLSLIEDTDQELIMRLSVSSAPFDLSTVKALAKVANVSNPQKSLRRLLSVHLLQSYTETNAEFNVVPRWRVHSLLAAFLSNSLNAGELRVARIALAEHLIRNYSAKRWAIHDEEEFLWKSRASRHFFRAHEFSRAKDLIHDIAGTAKALGHYDLLLDLTIELPESVLKEDSWLQYHAAHCLLITGRFEQAVELAKQIDAPNQLTVRLGAARIIAEGFIALNRLPEALDTLMPILKKAYRNYKRVSSRSIRHAESVRAWILILMGELTEPEKILTRHLQSAKKINDERGGAVSLTYLGMLYRRKNTLVIAKRYLNQALELFGSIPDRRGLAWSHGQLSLCLLGNSQESGIYHATEAVKIASEIAEAGHTYYSLLNQLKKRRLPPPLLEHINKELDRLNALKSYYIK